MCMNSLCTWSMLKRFCLPEMTSFPFLVMSLWYILKLYNKFYIIWFHWFIYNIISSQKMVKSGRTDYVYSKFQENRMKQTLSATLAPQIGWYLYMVLYLNLNHLAPNWFLIGTNLHYIWNIFSNKKFHEDLTPNIMIYISSNVWFAKKTLRWSHS